jgi:hypothetical protein
MKEISLRKSTLINIMIMWNEFEEDVFISNYSGKEGEEKSLLEEYEKDVKFYSEKIPVPIQFEVVNKLSDFPFSLIHDLTKFQDIKAVILTPDFRVRIFENAHSYFIFTDDATYWAGDLLYFGNKGLEYLNCVNKGIKRMTPIGWKAGFVIYVETQTLFTLLGMNVPYIEVEVFEPLPIEAT